MSNIKAIVICIIFVITSLTGSLLYVFHLKDTISSLRQENLIFDKQIQEQSLITKSYEKQIKEQNKRIKEERKIYEKQIQNLKDINNSVITSCDINTYRNSLR